MAENSERDRLFKKYPYIVAWGKMLSSHGYYIQRQCAIAEHDNASSDAVTKRDNGTWKVLSEFKQTTQEELEEYKLGDKGGMIIH